MPFGSKIIRGILSINKIVKAAKETDNLFAVLAEKELGVGEFIKTKSIRTEYMLIGENEKDALVKISDKLRQGGRGITRELADKQRQERLVDIFYHEKGSPDFIKQFADEKLEEQLSKLDISKNLQTRMKNMIEGLRLDEKTKRDVDKQLARIKDRVDPKKGRYILKIESLLETEDGRQYDEHANPKTILGTPKSS